MASKKKGSRRPVPDADGVYPSTRARRGKALGKAHHVKGIVVYGDDVTQHELFTAADIGHELGFKHLRMQHGHLSTLGGRVLWKRHEGRVYVPKTSPAQREAAERVRNVARKAIAARHGLAQAARRKARAQSGPRMHAERVPLDSGGYDSRGRYWGVGQPLFRVSTDDGSFDDHVRATNAAEAKTFGAGMAAERARRGG